MTVVLEVEVKTVFDLQQLAKEKKLNAKSEVLEIIEHACVLFFTQYSEESPLALEQITRLIYIIQNKLGKDYGEKDKSSARAFLASMID